MASKTDADRARDNILDEAVRDGKIKPSEKAQFRAKYNARPKMYRHLLTAPVEKGGLMPGLVGNSREAATADDAYPREWLGQQTQAGTVMNEEGPTLPAAVPDPGASYPREWLGNPEPSGPITVEQ